MADKEVVLFVEDEPLVRDSLVLELEEAGFEVVTAENGDEASYILPKMRRIDILLTDIRMPGRINGWVLADMARCRRPNLPIIYTSGFSPQQSAEVEGSIFLAKPYRIGEILKAIAELKSANDELASANYDLQTSNDELACSNEEFRSLNEDLRVVNAQLKARVNELSRVNRDLARLVDDAQIATVFLDREFSVKRFTAAATELFDLAEDDIGRPISKIASRLRLGSLQEAAANVIRSRSAAETQIESADGTKRYLMRMLPDRTAENVVAGVIINFVDVTRITAAEGEILRLTRDLLNRVENLEQILDLIPAGIFIVGNDPTQHIQVNRCGVRLLGERSERKGPRDVPVPYRLFNQERELAFWEHPLQRAAFTGQAVPTTQGRLVRRDGSSVNVLMSAEPLLDDRGSPRGAIAAVIDISEGKIVPFSEDVSD